LTQFSKFCMALSIILVAGDGFATEHVFGPGATYPIAEEDALVEIHNRVEAANVKEVIAASPREKWSVWNGYPLPRASETRTRGYVPWYSLEFDITGPQGEILYPEGFTFNPLEHVNYPGRIIVFKLDQLEFIEPLIKPGDQLIADAGDVVDVAFKTGHHINILSKKIADRLGVQVAPSIIYQEGKQFIIREIEIKVSE